MFLLSEIVLFGYAGMQGVHWKFFNSTDLYEGFYHLSRSYPLHKGTVLVWVKLQYTEKGIAEYVKQFGKDYENLSYSLQFWEIGCPVKTQRILSINQYSVEGNIIRTKPAKGQFSESLGKSLSEAACK